ncbi:hypothetical protein BpHYR1_003367 [Brachionus plicatilis]|uniref:Uncharacterized protein n=1 Tax=Brachionus plicatilis TaxID=10195 RepID=A0A3M7SIV0_BRAPC|nr:hypothetical protein BpHYR1_003367 [Brachionus plicatilis]
MLIYKQICLMHIYRTKLFLTAKKVQKEECLFNFFFYLILICWFLVNKKKLEIRGAPFNPELKIAPQTSNKRHGEQTSGKP